MAILEGVIIGLCVSLMVVRLDPAFTGAGKTRGKTEGSTAAVMEPTQPITAMIIPAKTFILSVDLSSDIDIFLRMMRLKIASCILNELIKTAIYSITCSGW